MHIQTHAHTHTLSVSLSLSHTDFYSSSNLLRNLFWKFGSEDYSADVGITRTKSGDELLFARSAVVTHAKAFR
jgi:citrate lyase beta subunit